jgi:hypothetical protein
MNFAEKVPGMLADLPKLPTSVDNLNTHAFSGLTPVMLVVGAVLVLALIWAIFLRRSERDPRSRVLSEDAPSSGRRRRRHRRREHRRSNPTLAETGGLPPAKTEPEQGDHP